MPRLTVLPPPLFTPAPDATLLLHPWLNAGPSLPLPVDPSEAEGFHEKPRISRDELGVVRPAHSWVRWCGPRVSPQGPEPRPPSVVFLQAGDEHGVGGRCADRDHHEIWQWWRLREHLRPLPMLRGPGGVPKRLPPTFLVARIVQGLSFASSRSVSLALPPFSLRIPISGTPWIAPVPFTRAITLPGLPLPSRGRGRGLIGV